MICIAYSVEPEHALAYGRTRLPPSAPPHIRIRACNTRVHTHIYTHTHCALFSSVGSRRSKRRPRLQSCCLHLILLVRVSRDVVRNTYVTPKLIRYNFTGRLHSFISLSLPVPARLSDSQLGCLACLPCLPCLPCLLACPLPRLPISQQPGSRNRIPKIFPTFP